MCAAPFQEYLFGYSGTSQVQDLSVVGSPALAEWEPGCGVVTGGDGRKHAFALDLGVWT